MMKARKRRIEYISFYNHTGLEKHFSRMAKKGWLIEKISNLYWTYKRIEPADIHFCVTYYPRASEFDPEPSDAQQTFHDFCAYTGWKLACTWHQMQVFYNEKAPPIPLETDPVLEVETLHKACKKNFLPSYFILLALSLIMGSSFITRIFSDPIGLLSSASDLLSVFSYVCMSIICLVELSAYFLWYSKAKRASADGIFVDTPSTNGIHAAIVMLYLIPLVGWILNGLFAGDSVFLWVIILSFVFIFALFGIVSSVKEGLKKIYASRGMNKVLTFLACFVVFFALTGIVVSLTQFISHSGLMESQVSTYDYTPLALDDLIDVNSDDYIQRCQSSETMLLGHADVQQYHIYDNGKSPLMPNLLYSITVIKTPSLYDFCKKQLFHTVVEGDNGKYLLEYRAVDAAPWGAREAYRQLAENGTEKNSYLLFYEDRFLLIHLDWEPTLKQMAIINQKLNP